LHAQNLKPVCKPDTAYHQIAVNLLKNDKDPNGDIMKVSRLNGQTFSNNLQITKPDTGIFTINDKGDFLADFSINFYGKFYMTYYVNDGKAGAGKTVKILVCNDIYLACPTVLQKGTDGVIVQIQCSQFTGTALAIMADGLARYYVQYSGGRIEISREMYDYLK
jgi:hypothetical protein